MVAGSIHVTLVMRTASDLQHLLAEVTSGCVQQRMLTWLIASNRMFSRNDVIRAEVKEDECSSAMRILQEHENSVQNAGNLSYISYMYIIFMYTVAILLQTVILLSERLQDPVSFSYCKERGEWFWTVDNFSWIHVTRLFVPSGVNKNKVPRDEDVRVIRSLAMQQLNVTRPVSPCPVCKFKT